MLDPAEILEATGLRVGELDLLVGGPPCQSFSTAGKRRTVQDPRGTLLWDFLRFVEVLRPRFFLMENVRGLLSKPLSITDRSRSVRTGAALRSRPMRNRAPSFVSSRTICREYLARPTTWTASR